MEKTLIRNGFIITMDPGAGDIADGDILIEDGLIKEVGQGIIAPDAAVFDAEEMIVLPGLINAHLHTCRASPEPTSPR